MREITMYKCLIIFLNIIIIILSIRISYEWSNKQPVKCELVVWQDGTWIAESKENGRIVAKGDKDSIHWTSGEKVNLGYSLSQKDKTRVILPIELVEPKENK